jgi:hypothetical protein
MKELGISESIFTKELTEKERKDLYEKFYNIIKKESKKNLTDIEDNINGKLTMNKDIENSYYQLPDKIFSITLCYEIILECIKKVKNNK